MRPRGYLIAIPPESAHAQMSVLQHTGGGTYFRGEGGGGSDYFCGRCGRILAEDIPPSVIQNICVVCPKCLWLNGIDIDLGWARYVVEELAARKLSLQRAEELIAALKEWRGSTEEFIALNPDVSDGPISWLARVSISTLIAVLALFCAIYYGQRSEHVAAAGGRDEQLARVGVRRVRVTHSTKDIRGRGTSGAPAGSK